MGKPDLWMPLYVADYLADTQHLTTAHHGAYLLLLMASWMRGGRLPGDDEQLASICRMDRKTWVKAKPVLSEFFTPQDGAWVQKRLAEEYEQAQKISDKNKKNGGKGGRPRNPNETQTVTQTKPKQEANGKPDETPPPSQLPKAKVKSIVGQRPDDARSVLEYLNEQAGRKFEPVPANLDLIVARLKESTVERCKRVVDNRVKAWKDDPEMSQYLRPETIFNRTKFAQYIGQLDAPLPGQKPWTESWSGIVEKGKSLGIEKSDDESNPEFKARVMAAAKVAA